MHTRSTEGVAGPTCQTSGHREGTQWKRALFSACFLAALFLLAALLCAYVQAIIMENDSPADVFLTGSRPLVLLAATSGESRLLFFPTDASTAVAAPAPFHLELSWKPVLLLLFLLLLLAPRTQWRRRLAAYLRRRGHSSGQDCRVAVLPSGSNGAQRNRPSVSSHAAGEQLHGVVQPATTFADVAGINEVRADLEEMVQFLRSPQKFARLGARIPRGALLAGAPGTGKTLLARAVAGEADVPFLQISASELVEVFVGMGASRVRNLFQKARHLAPAVIFIDEIDAVGRKRAGKTAAHEERDQTLNQLLVEMDGFRASQAVVVLAATNRVDILDDALLRPGRFDRHITVPLPDCAGREAILALHTARVPLHEEVALPLMARLTVGMSGADLASLVNEAALCAVRNNLEQVDQACFEQALARLQLGAQRSFVMSETQRRVTAYHESGHALVAYYLPEAGTVNGVTILPRGQSLGVTQVVSAEDRYNYSRQMLMARIAVGLGGRVAEELTAGREGVTSGAENDFRHTTALARRMVTRWGMSEEIGVSVVEDEESGDGWQSRRVDPMRCSAPARTLALDASGALVPDGQPERSAAFAMLPTLPRAARSLSMSLLVEREVSKILDEGYGLAKQILQEHIAVLQVLADTLVMREQLNRAEFEALMQQTLAD
jgi:ATP-dependent metalloprotease FtsH